MPPRLNKRQQREQQELESLAVPHAEPVESSEDEGVTPAKAAIGFAALFSPEDQASSSDDAKPAKARKAKKKKKKAGEASTATPTVSATPPPRSPRPPAHTPAAAPPSKKAAKKAKAREKKADRDELDRTLADLSIKYPELKSVATATFDALVSPSQQTLASLLSVSLAHLDSEAEMRKFFGAKVIQSHRSTTGGGSGSSSRRQPGTQRSNLTRPQPSWWAAKQREGLSIRALTDDEVEEKGRRHSWQSTRDTSGEKWWTVEYSKRYKGMTMAFMRTVMSGDPQGFWDLLGKLPWHADTLLQLSEVYRHREEYAQAVDFVDRALFTYERSFVGAFTFTSGLNRLDFDHVENRPFFLAVHRQITDLQRRGCVRTAFEFARLLYSLDPWTDPHGALFHLDYLAVKSGMHQWLLDVFELFAARRKAAPGENITRVDPSVLPGWAYARALALRAKEDTETHEASTEALRDAMRSFPAVVPLLADKIDATLPLAIRGHRAFRIETDASALAPPTAAVHLLSHLYVQRSSPLWKDAAVSAWFASTAALEFASLPAALPPTSRGSAFLAIYVHEAPRYAAYRHIMVLEAGFRALLAFVPRAVAGAKTLACDPLPPPTAVSGYDDAFFRGAEDLFAWRARTRAERAADERQLERLVPDALFRGQLLAYFNAHPHLARQFPGGVVQFAQMVAQMPADVLDDMLLEHAVGGAVELEDRGMPGQLFVDFTDEEDEGGAGAAEVHREEHRGEEDEDEDEDEEDAESGTDDEAIQPMPIRMLRNLMGRLWPGNPVPSDSSDDCDDEPEVVPAPLDDGGVD